MIDCDQWCEFEDFSAAIVRFHLKVPVNFSFIDITGTTVNELQVIRSNLYVRFKFHNLHSVVPAGGGSGEFRLLGALPAALPEDPDQPRVSGNLICSMLLKIYIIIWRSRVQVALASLAKPYGLVSKAASKKELEDSRLIGHMQGIYAQHA